MYRNSAQWQGAVFLFTGLIRKTPLFRLKSFIVAITMKEKSWIRCKCTICLWCCIFWQSQKNPTSPCNQVSWTSRLCKGSKLWPSGQTCCRWVPLSRPQGDTESSCPEPALWIPSICIWHGRGFHWSMSHTRVQFCLCWLKQRTFRTSSPNDLLWKENLSIYQLLSQQY